jgi:hypothetical protein
MSDICKIYNSKMIVLVLGDTARPIDHEGLDGIPGVRIVDAQRALLEQLPERTETAHRKLYGHWTGNPPVYVDYHPNPTAHRIIAGELAKSMENKLANPGESAGGTDLDTKGQR